VNSSLNYIEEDMNRAYIACMREMNAHDKILMRKSMRRHGCEVL
jgi:RNase P subunit RPR2